MFKNKTLKINFFLILPMLILVSFVSSITFAYWFNVKGDNATNPGQTVEIGEWDVYVHLMTNLSDDFTYEKIALPIGEALGETLFLAKFPTNPNPKTHPDIDHSEYTFDNWYKSDGTLFNYNDPMTTDIYVYPSWNSKTLFSYSIGNKIANLSKASTATISGNLYIPGWRYHGLEIATLNRNFDGITVDKLTIGEGIKKIAYGAFRNSAINSLELEEGLEIIEHSVFQNVGLTGSLVFPSTIKEINSNVFDGNVNLNGTLDLSQANDLTLIGQTAFRNTSFTGDLKLGSSLETIGSSAFVGTKFNGTLDLNYAVNLTTIKESVFEGVPFTGGLYIPPKLKTIEHSAFKGNKFNGTLDLSAAVSLESIGSSAFNGASFTGDLDMSTTSLSFIGKSAFANTGFTGDLILSSKIVTIGTHVFFNTGFTGQLDLSHATLLEIIDTSVFQNVKFTGSLILPENIVSIGQTAFSNTNFTGELDLSALINLTYLGTNAFSSVGFTGTLVIPPNLPIIPSSSFSSTLITKLDLSNALSLTAINPNAFNSSKIEEIIFNYDYSVLKTIGTTAFEKNNFIGYLALPQGVTSIGTGAFNSNGNMTGIYIPSSVVDLPGKVIGNKVPFTFDIQSLTAHPNWGANWYYPGTSSQQGQIVNFGVNPPY